MYFMMLGLREMEKDRVDKESAAKSNSNANTPQVKVTPYPNVKSKNNGD